MLKNRQQEMTGDTPQALPVTPQRRRRAARKRLYERTNSVVARLLQDLKLSGAGRDVGKILRTPRLSNRAALTQVLNREIDKSLGITTGQRNTLTADQAEAAFPQLDMIADTIRARIKKGLGEKQKHA